MDLLNTWVSVVGIVVGVLGILVGWKTLKRPPSEPSMQRSRQRMLEKVR